MLFLPVRNGPDYGENTRKHTAPAAGLTPTGLHAAAALHFSIITGSQADEAHAPPAQAVLTSSSGRTPFI